MGSSEAQPFAAALLAATVLAACGATALAQEAPAVKVEVGVLTCLVGKGGAAADEPTRTLECDFDRIGDAPNETYAGDLRTFTPAGDADDGSVTVMSWQVMAPSTDLAVGALGGSYETTMPPGAVDGDPAEQAMLVGGADGEISLVPLSESARIEGAPMAAELRLSTVKADAPPAQATTTVLALTNSWMPSRPSSRP